ncbi:hypothetical protein [Cellulomonas sp. URHE0023]|uniref:hypothetical protein n=1 Tax=Cellulomonas sp. URHE0023 TaxID=1380354 RepID=UPI00048289D7|nr:hypothetical protein [Cellulomonas sp. URHE0023]
MLSMYAAANAMFKDMVCDLAVELAPEHGWGSLVAPSSDRIETQMRRRVERQRDQRGEPGDARRAPAQRY